MGHGHPAGTADARVRRHPGRRPGQAHAVRPAQGAAAPRRAPPAAARGRRRAGSRRGDRHPRGLWPRWRAGARGNGGRAPALGAAGRAAWHRARTAAGDAGGARRPPGAGAVRRRAADATCHAAAAGGGRRGRRGACPAEREDAGPDRLWAHRARPRRQCRAHRRAQGRQPEGARDRRSEHRAHGCLGQAPARMAGGTAQRQRAGRVLPDRRGRDGGACGPQGQRDPGRARGRGARRQRQAAAGGSRGRVPRAAARANSCSRA